LGKAVPVALVLIAGAAVVLWFGNQLNSWVLGGLIGGLASLLLSIPISLALFTHFARQHDESGQYPRVLHKRLRSHRSVALSHYLPHEIDTRYHDDEYALADGEISTIVEERYQPPTTDSGWLDEEFGSPIPPARQHPPSAPSRHTTRNMSGRRLPTVYGVQPQKNTPASRQASDAEEEYKTRKTTRRMVYPGLPSTQDPAFRSRFRSEAMRTARLEAAQQYIDESDVSFEDPSEPFTRPSPRPSVRRSSRYGYGHQDDDQAQ
jgi:hypothetical protein